MTETRPIGEDAPGANAMQTGANASQNVTSTSVTGHLALVPTWMPLDIVSDTGHTSAGSGGDGMSVGVISSTPFAAFMPSNAAIAGPYSNVVAHQGNDAWMNQHVTEMAGVGGQGGIGNIAVGGDGS